MAITGARPQSTATYTSSLWRFSGAGGTTDGCLLRRPAGAEGAPVLAMGLPGHLRRIGEGSPGELALLRCSGRACDGLALEVELGDARALDASLIGVRFGLPREAAKLEAARPANAHPQYGAESTIRIVPVRI